MTVTPYIPRYLDHNPQSVALVGMGPSITNYMNDTLTQEFDPAVADETWTINMSSNFLRHDMTIWMDDLADQAARFPKLFDALRKWNKPVLTSRAYRNIVDSSYDYPIQEVGLIGMRHFGKPYLNNGVAMAIAYALWKGVKTMRIYGCDFTYPDRNYAESGRACVEAWITIAAMNNMNCIIAANSSLFDTVGDQGIYGYKEQPPIVMPDGRIFQYQRPATGTATGAATDAAAYTPEDSSGAKPNGAGHPEVSGIAGRAARHVGEQRRAETADGHAPPAIG